MLKTKLALQKFIAEKNKKVLFTPGPASLSKENIMGLEPCFGRGDGEYDKIENLFWIKLKKLLVRKNCKISGSGSLALEMMTLNFLYGSVLIIKTGYYSDRLYSISSAKKNFKFIKKLVYVDINEVEKISGKFDWFFLLYRN